MKKILGIVAMMMLVPMVAFSMEAVSDAEMEAVSGAGVVIDFDTGFTVETELEDFGWGATTGTAAVILATATDEHLGVDIKFADATGVNASVTINVNAAATGTTGTANYKPAGVQIGLKGLGVDVTMPASGLNLELPSATGVQTAAGSIKGDIGFNISAPPAITISAM